MHCTMYDLSLKGFRKIYKVCGISADTNKQVLVILRMLQSVLKFFLRMDVELNVPSVTLHEGLDQSSELVKLLIAVQQAL